ncbi:MAG: alpha-ketoacid dehydrogenase subunit beta [Alphaproteobacteria bacterium]|nr:alpha-ketoacid dehydrogenase subunit beta [Alphaproteobacteria bacterium]
MPKQTFQEAVVAAIAEEMRRDKDVFIMGEDIGPFGGPLKSCNGLWEEFGAQGRVIDTPVSEGGFVGAGVGAAFAGKRPIVDLMFLEFLGLVVHQFGLDGGAMHYYADGKAKVPLVLRAKYGVGPFHGHAYDFHSWLLNIPGVKIAVPSNPADAKGLMTAAIRDDNPVLFLEHMALYHAGREDVPEGEHLVPFGRAAIKRKGGHVTVVATALMVKRALAAAATLAKEGIEAEIIDLRTVMPWDKAAVLDSVKKTGRLIVACEAIKAGGSASEVAAVVAEEGFDLLKAPILRIAPPSVPVPFSRRLEKAYLPDADDIAAAGRRLVK